MMQYHVSVDGDLSVLHRLLNGDTNIGKALPSGGLAGINSLAFLAAVQQFRLPPSNHWYGVSVGSTGAVSDAFGIADRVATMYRDIFCTHDFIPKGKWSWVHWFTGRMVNLSLLEAVMSQMLDEYGVRAPQGVIRFGLTNFDDGQLEVVPVEVGNKKGLVKLARASSQLPFVDEGFVVIGKKGNKKRITDGGIADPLALHSCYVPGQTTGIILVMTNPKSWAASWLERRKMELYFNLTHQRLRLSKGVRLGILSTEARYMEALRQCLHEASLPVGHPERTFLPPVPVCIVWPSHTIGMLQNDPRVVWPAYLETRAEWEALLPKIAAGCTDREVLFGDQETQQTLVGAVA